MEKKEVYICQQQPNFEEDEIDLRELFQTIWKYKKFIAIFTFVITLLAGIYAFTKTPIYETKHTFMLAQIDGKVIHKPSNVKEYLSSIYKYELDKKFKTVPNAYLSSIEIPKKSDLFIKVNIDGLSNNYTLKKASEVLENLQKLDENQIKQYKLKLNNEINNLNMELKNLDTFETTRIKNQILQVTEKIADTEKLIKYQKEQVKDIDKKIKELQNKVNFFSKQLLKTKDDILSYQTLLTTYNETIQTLSTNKNKLITDEIPKLEDNLNNLQNNIRLLEKQLKIDIPKQKKDIKNQITGLKLSISNSFNTKEIGKPLINDYPIKPKRALIVI